MFKPGRRDWWTVVNFCELGETWSEKNLEWRSLKRSEKSRREKPRQQNPRLCLIVKVRAFPHAQCDESVQDSDCTGVRPRESHLLAGIIGEKKRLQFARERKDWTVERWERVMWSDISRFTLLQRDGWVRVRREAHEAIVPTVQASEAVLWSRVASGGQVQAQQHYESTEWPGYPINWIFFSFLDVTGIFQDHDAKLNQAQIVKEWIGEHEESFSRMNWPPHSPDLHPTESLWDALEKTLPSGSTLLSRPHCEISAKNEHE